MTDPTNESEILEKLNSAPSVRGFFIATTDILEDAVDTLVQKIFRSDYLAVQAVIKPLLESSGPLGDLMVRVKLLFGLGVIAAPIYHDIEELVRLKHKLNSDGTEYKFTDAQVIRQVEKLKLLKNSGIGNFTDSIQTSNMDEDSEFYQLQISRQQQVIKSSLSLIVVDICNSLNIDSPFSKHIP